MRVCALVVCKSESVLEKERERERERTSVRWTVRDCVYGCGRKRVSLCVREREREEKLIVVVADVILKIIFYRRSQ